MEEISAKKVYFDTRRLAWFGAVALVAVMIVSIYELGTAAVPIITAGLPTLGALIAAYTGIDKNWGRAQS